jgi:capsular polysaccharide biosynthesis protein
VAGQSQWKTVTKVSTGSPNGVQVISAGPPQKPFPRPPPRILDPDLLLDFKDSFNLMQDVSATGANMFQDVSSQYVAVIPAGFVEGEAGIVYDAAGNVYHLPFMFHNRTNPALPMPHHFSPQQAIQKCSRHYPRMASVIQRYGHMYYHWLEETLPRVVMLQDAGVLTPDTKLLTWGQPYEAAWLQALGVHSDQIVTYDPETVYCTDMLLVPTPVPRITPPKESLVAIRSALGVEVLPESQRDIIVYVSRKNEPTRRVANEEQLLKSIRASFLGTPVVVYERALSPAESIALFQRAKVVIGPHGAGLSHILFSAPGTAVIEFLFMADPPMMFWHTAAALEQQYWLLPVPQSYYMQNEMHIPEGEVLDMLSSILRAGPAPVNACKPGTAGRAGGLCSVCPPGSYAFNTNSLACKLCAPGRVAVGTSNAYCSTCQPGTVSNADGTACEPCPQGTYSVLAGSSDAVTHCLTPDARRRRLQEQALSVDMLSKLSPVFAKQMNRRSLIQGAGGGQSATITQAELCAARTSTGLTAGGPYLSSIAGPYGVNGVALCPPPQLDGENTTTIPVQEPTYGPIASPIVDPPSIPGDGTRGNPEQPELQPELPPPAPVGPKTTLDAWIIALISTAAAMIVLPLLVCAGMWCSGRRRRRKVARTPTVGPAPSPPSTAPGSVTSKQKNTMKKAGNTTGFAVSNPTFDIRASSTSADISNGSSSSKDRR